MNNNMNNNIDNQDELDFDFNRDKNKKDEYDPIKLPKDGKQAEAVIWSTSVLERAVDGINKGLPLKANPFIGKNTQLLKPDLVYKRTKEEVEDYIHCMKDPLFFAEKCFIKTPTGMQACKLRDYQRRYIMHLVNNRFSLLLSCRQAGKSFSYLTNINIKIPYFYYKKLACSKLKKYYFYIDNNDIYINLPFFELYNLYNKSKLWKLKYYIYKLIYKINKYEKKQKLNTGLKDVQIKQQKKYG